MSRNNSKSSTNNVPAETAAPVKHRTRLNILTVYRQTLNASQSYFVAIHNGEVTAAFAYDGEQNQLVLIPDTMGAYAGMKSYVRTMRKELSPVLVTKSIDADVVSAQADKYLIEKFLQNYIDRLVVRQLAALKATETADNEPTPVL